MGVISAEENERFSFPETGQLNFFFSRKSYISIPENMMFNPPRKKNILISRKLQAYSPEKTNFNLPKTEVL